MYEKEIGANRGDISNDTNRLKEFTADVNVALDYFVEMAIRSSGTWQWDDSNQTDYPTISTSLVANQRDYSFTTDGSGNIILDIYRVFILPSATSGTYKEIFPVDVQTERNTEGFTNGLNTTGSPIVYDKTGNAIFLDPIPGYSASMGIKVYINREASYFAYTDTTKKAGIPGIFHEYLYLKSAQDYARRNTLTNQNKIEEQVVRMEEKIVSYFSLRPKDERPRMRISNESNR